MLLINTHSSTAPGRLYLWDRQRQQPLLVDEQAFGTVIWSPDGTQLAYTRGIPPVPRTLHVIRLDGTPVAEYPISRQFELFMSISFVTWNHCA